MSVNVEDFELIDNFNEDMYVWVLNPDVSPQSKRFLLSKILQNNSVTYGIDDGIVNDYSITVQSQPLNYTAGQIFFFTSVTTNTGSCTININGVGIKSLVDRNGNALAPGAIPIDSFNIVGYNGTVFQLLSSNASNGEANTASNVGFGEGVFKQKNGVNLEFKSLTSSGRASISSGIDEINVDVPDDSILFTSFDIVSVVLSGSDITLDINNLRQRIFDTTASHSSNFNILKTNASNAVLISYTFQISAAIDVVFESNDIFPINQFGWDDGTKTLSLVELGTYEITYRKRGSNYLLNISNVY